MTWSLPNSHTPQKVTYLEVLFNKLNMEHYQNKMKTIYLLQKIDNRSIGIVIPIYYRNYNFHIMFILRNFTRLYSKTLNTMYVYKHGIYIYIYIYINLSSPPNTHTPGSYRPLNDNFLLVLP